MLQLADTVLYDKNTPPNTHPETLTQSPTAILSPESFFKKGYSYFRFHRGSPTVELGSFQFSDTGTATHDYVSAIGLIRSFARTRTPETTDHPSHMIMLAVRDISDLTANAGSEPFVGDWLSLYTEVDFLDLATLLHYATELDWDGEGADPIDEETINIAHDFADRFLRRFQRPDVSASPHGAVEFDWTMDASAMFTISVGPPPEHQVVFAGLFGDEQLSGKCQFDTWSLPDELVRCFSRLKDA